jgi:hypothetical protein
MDRCDTLPNSHYSIQYLRERQLPANRWSKLYHIDKFSDIDKLGVKYERLDDLPRLVIPTFDKNNKLISLNGRSYDDTKGLRYIHINIADEFVPFGYDEYDYNKTAYVLEGQLDSLLLPNALSVNTSDLRKAIPFIRKQQTIFIPDSSPRNSAIVNRVKQLSKEDVAVSLLPEIDGCKDINDMVRKGLTIDHILSTIIDHTFSGLRLIMEIEKWRRI